MSPASHPLAALVLLCLFEGALPHTHIDVARPPEGSRHITVRMWKEVDSLPIPCVDVPVRILIGGSPPQDLRTDENGIVYIDLLDSVKWMASIPERFSILVEVPGTEWRRELTMARREVEAYAVSRASHLVERGRTL